MKTRAASAGSLCALAVGLAGSVGCNPVVDAEPMTQIQTAPAPQATPPEPVPVAASGAGPCSATGAIQFPARAVRSPLAVQANPELNQALALVEGVVKTYARDPDDPWAVGHAILALGPTVQLTNDQPAVDWLFTRYAHVQDVNGSQGVAFPPKEGEIRIEPHTDLLLKAFTEAGVAPTRVVQVDGVDHTVEELYRRSLCAAWTDGAAHSFGVWNDAPWTLQALSDWAAPGARWTSDGGHAMTMDRFASETVAQLQRETAILKEARAKGQTVQKRGQGIFAYTCGGAHLIQGAAWAVGRGFGTEADRAAIREEVSVHLWRMDLELAAVADPVVEAHPEYAAKLINQRMKYLGHLLETVHKAAAMGLFVPTLEEQAKLNQAAETLADVILDVEARGYFKDLPNMKTTDYQTYLDYVGDSAHAKRGLDLHLGVGLVRY